MDRSIGAATPASPDTASEPVTTPDRARFLALTLVAVGVVYGDIGTSPLYTIRACFAAQGMSVTPDAVLGILSLIFWSLIVVVTLKYQSFVMRADNKGEGGILALLALLDPWGRRGSKRATLTIIVGLFGAALLYGDGVLTPAISVLSAVEGLEVAAPHLGHLVLPITVGVLIALFAGQRFGTGRVGAVFGPITVAWFIAIAAIGIRQILVHPGVLAALWPGHGVTFLLAHREVGAVVLGAVFLAVTGAEALYADLGHFGIAPIRLAWFALVLPALVLSYFGQGAALIEHPEFLANPFFMIVPSAALYPMVALATAATVIASQAVISGAFSLTGQAMQMGQSPRMHIVQTSATERGQIYIPVVNWMLMVMTIAVVLGFGRSDALASAYGIAVSTTMVITTLLMFSLCMRRWNWPLPLAAGVTGAFLLIDLAFFLANAAKFWDGGWLPISIAIVAFTMMTTWATGRRNLIHRLRLGTMSLSAFLDKVRDERPVRVPGTAVFMAAPGLGLPPALQHHLERIHALHELVILLSVVTEDVPWVPVQDRVRVSPLGQGFQHVTVRFGFMQTPNVPLALRKLVDHDLALDFDRTTYYIGRETVIPSERVPGMMLWREKLFAFMQRNSTRATDFFGIPPERTVELGLRIVI